MNGNNNLPYSIPKINLPMPISIHLCKSFSMTGNTKKKIASYTVRLRKFSKIYAIRRYFPSDSLNEESEFCLPLEKSPL